MSTPVPLVVVSVDSRSLLPGATPSAVAHAYPRLMSGCGEGQSYDQERGWGCAFEPLMDPLNPELISEMLW
ncbi:hypothetical protein OH492_12520 [Vibrio chagasii]|nr:hypothetical protein [Vibrio chagasii]